MKLQLLNVLILSLFSASFVSQGEIGGIKLVNNKSDMITVQKMKKLRHLVLFKFKETVTASEITIVEKEFALLPSKIEQVKDYEWGINNSPENLNKGFTHGFLLTFDSENGRDQYLPHPAHMRFVKIIEPLIEDVLVIDYWTNSN